ncbi:MAG: hypothetical protein ACRD1X_07960, partial [Vicinamibacteria bacterium]
MSAKTGMPLTQLKIAVLAWGSLYWNRGVLNAKGRWRRDGPRLPIEFARISQDGRLTLVIVPRRRLIRTYWAPSGCADLDSAIGNLAKREGSSLANIGYMLATGEHRTNFPSCAQVLHRWVKLHRMEAVIWTDLESNFLNRLRRPFSMDAAIQYLKTLDGAVKN